MAAIAEELVERATRGDRSRSSYAEFRNRGGATHVVVADPAAAWWKYLLAPPIFSSRDPYGGDAAKVLDDQELRVLSKASAGAGAYLVPADLDELVTSARRARGVIGELARASRPTTAGRSRSAPPPPTEPARGLPRTPL